MKAWSHLRNWERISILVLTATFAQACNQVTAPAGGGSSEATNENFSSSSNDEAVAVPKYNLIEGEREFSTRISTGDTRVCLSSTASIIARSHTEIELTGNATVQGSVALLRGSNLRCSGNAHVSGTVHAADENSIFTSGKS